MMDGKITVRSKLRVGTEFLIDLNFPVEPKNTPADETSAKKDDTENARTGKTSSKHKLYMAKKLLLAEDNPLNREIATEILSEYGFEIEVAGNGSEAYEKVKNSGQGYYYAVLMDVQMPVMNGYEATWRIRALEDKTLAQIPIIAMTANAFDEDRKMALMAGMNDFVAKPIEVKKLLKALDAVGENCA
jgi:CheY-like chemotaxis protein